MLAFAPDHTAPSALTSRLTVSKASLSGKIRIFVPMPTSVFFPSSTAFSRVTSSSSGSSGV